MGAEAKNKDKGKHVKKVKSAKAVKEAKSAKEPKGKVFKIIKKDVKVAKKKSKKRKAPRFDTYIHRVLREIHEDMGISKQGMSVMNDLVCGVMNDLLDEAGNIILTDDRGTVSHLEIESAVRLRFPAVLGRGALEEGHEAIARYKVSKSAIPKYVEEPEE